VGFAQAYSFKYSPRPGTPAASLPGQVPEEVKLARLHRLQALLDRQQAAFNAGCVGKTMPVLFERAGRHPGQLVGRTPHQQAVHAAAAPALLGQVAPVAIERADSNSLSGSLASHSP
jgi:tRNA-2-methylthio-N6-dimethylallyladenosine synthase